MSDAKSEAIVTVTNGGITVEKSFEPDDFPVPTIAFTLRSDRDVTVSVRLVDSVPEDVSPENVGFHPKYGAEFWDVDGESIVFEREFSPGEEYTTVYGLRGSDAEEAEKFMSEPTLESVDPPLEASSSATEEPESATEQEADLAEDPDVETDTDDAVDASSEPDVDINPIQLDEPDEDDSGQADVDAPDELNDTADESTSETTDDRDSERETTDSDDPRGSDSVLASLATEIEAADPDDPELAALRDALGMDLTRKSVEARIEHLQSTVADLDAYTDALEEFLDENGDAQTLLDDLQSEYEATTDRIAAIETKTDANEETVAELEAELESKIETRIADVEDEIGGLESRLESIEDELSEVVEMRNRLASALGGLGAVPDEEPSDDEE